MEGSENVTGNIEEPRSVDAVKAGFNEFLDGEPKYLTITRALDKLKEVDWAMGGSVSKVERQRIVAELAEAFNKKMVARQQEWLDKQPNNFAGRNLIAAIAVTTFLPWKAEAELRALERYESKNPIPLKPGMLYEFNQMLVEHGLVPIPSRPESRVQRLGKSLGNLVRHSKKPSGPV